MGADDIAYQLSPDDPAKVRVTAGREFSRRLSRALAEAQSLVIESTLSGGSLARSVAKARAAGYLITVVLVFLDSADLCLRRIAERVAQGGHDVRRRFTRVVPVFWQQYRPLAHQALLVFNGGESFSVVAEAQGDAWAVYDDQMWTTFQSFLPTDDHEDPTSED